jgi:hypothetical protein
MGTFLLLSKSSATFWLHISEAVLFVFGILLVVGLIGEKKVPWWHSRFRTFELLVIIGVAGELLGDGGVFVFSGDLQTIADAELAQITTDVGSTRTAAKDAADAAGRAKDSAKQAHDESVHARTVAGNAKALAAGAESLAQGARQEADSFEKDIVSAKQQAADAESHLAEALQRAAEATAELNRLKSPRLLTNVPKLISTLAAFKGTEYAFSGVFGDGESVSFLQSIDGVLQSAGWKRTLPRGGRGVQLLVKLPGSDNPFAIPSFIADGIRISVQFPGEFSVLQSTPIESLPMYLRATQSLYDALSSSISPAEEHPASVNAEKGESKTVFISIGKKP